MTLRRLFPDGAGRARGGRASPGAVVELPFRRSRPAPRSRFPRAGRLAAVVGPYRRPGPPLREDRTEERADRVSSGSVPRRAASKQRPSIDLHEDPRTLLRPGFIARPQPAAIEERGSDALPTDGMGGLWAGFQGDQ